MKIIRIILVVAYFVSVFSFINIGTSNNIVEAAWCAPPIPSADIYWSSSGTCSSTGVAGDTRRFFAYCSTDAQYQDPPNIVEGTGNTRINAVCDDSDPNIRALIEQVSSPQSRLGVNIQIACLSGGATMSGTFDWARSITCNDGNRIELRDSFTSAPDPDPDGTGGSGITAESIPSDCSDETLTASNCRIVTYLVNGINFLSALVGIIIIFSMMFAGFQYMTARDNAGQIQQARSRIIWAIIATGLFIFTYAILEFLVPGGVLP